MKVKCYPKGILIWLGPNKEVHLSWKEYDDLSIVLEHIKRAYELNRLDFLEFWIDERKGKQIS